MEKADLRPNYPMYQIAKELDLPWEIVLHIADVEKRRLKGFDITLGTLSFWEFKAYDRLIEIADVRGAEFDAHEAIHNTVARSPSIVSFVRYGLYISGVVTEEQYKSFS